MGGKKETTAIRKEMLKDALPFDRDFKTMLRELYCYGFKSLHQMTVETQKGNKSTDNSSTLRDSRARLNRILNLDKRNQDDPTQEPEKNSKSKKEKGTGKKTDIYYTMQDSVENPTNPFLNVYRFCNCSMFPNHLQIFAMLSPKIHQKWREPFEVPKYSLEATSSRQMKEMILKAWAKDRPSELTEEDIKNDPDLELNEKELSILLDEELSDEEKAELAEEIKSEEKFQIKKGSTSKEDLDELKKKFPGSEEKDLMELAKAEVTEEDLTEFIKEALKEKSKREISEEELAEETEKTLSKVKDALNEKLPYKVENRPRFFYVTDKTDNILNDLEDRTPEEANQSTGLKTSDGWPLEKVKQSRGLKTAEVMYLDFVERESEEASSKDSKEEIEDQEKAEGEDEDKKKAEGEDEDKTAAEDKNEDKTAAEDKNEDKTAAEDKNEDQKIAEDKIEALKKTEYKKEKEEEKEAVQRWIHALVNNDLGNYTPPVIFHYVHIWEKDTNVFQKFYTDHSREKKNEKNGSDTKDVKDGSDTKDEKNSGDTKDVKDGSDTKDKKDSSSTKDEKDSSNTKDPITIESEISKKDDRLEELKWLGFLRCKRETSGSDKYWLMNDVTISDIIQAGKEADEEFEDHFISALDFYSRYYFLGEVGMFLLDRLLPSDSPERNEYESPFRFRQDNFIQVLNDLDLLDLLGAIESGRWCLIEYRHAFAAPNSKNVKFLCFPLEIRISSANGREYLMYYDPIKRMCMSLRLDFICSMTLYSDKKVKSVLEGMDEPKYRISSEEIDAEIRRSRGMLRHVWGVSTGIEGRLENNATDEEKQKPVQVRLRVKFDPEKEPYIKDRIWREKRNGRFTVKQSGSKKTLNYRNRVYDPKEFYAWVKSFTGWDISPFRPYHKYKEPKSEENTAKSNYKDWDVDPDIIEALDRKKEKGAGDDISKEQEKYAEHKRIFNDVFSAYGQIYASLFTKYMLPAENKWDKDTDIDITDIKDIKGVNDRENESSAEWSPFYRHKSKDIIENTIENSTSVGPGTKGNWISVFTPDKVKEKFLYEDKEDQKLKCKYEWVNKEISGYERSPESFYYENVLPLSGIEVRWLKTILNDDCKDDDQHSGKIKCFLSDEEIEAVRKVLDQREEPELPADKVVYYDRYRFPAARRQNEEAQIKDFLKILRKRGKAEITFMAIPDDSVSAETYKPFVTDNAITKYPNMQRISGIFMPLRILFSKRDNFFTLCFWSGDDHKIYFVNASRIISIQEIKRDGSGHKNDEWTEAEKTLSEYYNQEKRSVKVKFNGNQNVPDRILMELSPWGKTCTFILPSDTATFNENAPLDSSANDNYELLINYMPDEKLSLVDQLIGFTYGEHVLTFEDQKNEIARMVKKRKKKQTDRTGDLETYIENQPKKEPER